MEKNNLPHAPNTHTHTQHRAQSERAGEEEGRGPGFQLRIKVFDLDLEQVRRRGKAEQTVWVQRVAVNVVKRHLVRYRHCLGSFN